MSTSFNRFLYMYRDKSLADDVTWRGYDIPARALARPSYMTNALKSLGLSYAGEHAFSQFMALYEVHDAKLAEKLLACWWVWSEVAKGRRVLGLKMRAVEGPQEGSGATCLAEDGPSAA